MAAARGKATVQVSLSLSTILLVIAWALFALGIILMLPMIEMTVPGLTPTVCFLASIAAKMLS